MPISYKTLFLLEADTFSLVEIKLLDVQSDDPAEVYFWFRLDKDSHTLQKLDFVSMSKDGDEQRREFKQGKLAFDEQAGTYSTEAGNVPLRTQTATAVPAELDDAIQRYFIGA
jgi:hypothetical protein